MPTRAGTDGPPAGKTIEYSSRSNDAHLSNIAHKIASNRADLRCDYMAKRAQRSVCVAAILRPNAALGLVSRVTPVQTAMRNCMRDEGRPFEFGSQVLISSHRKLLWSKAM